MKFSAHVNITSRPKTDMLVVPFWEDKKGPKCATDIGVLSKDLKPALSSGDFQGKKGQVLLVYLNGKQEKRVLLLGLGKRGDWSTEILRQAYGVCAKHAQKAKITSVSLPMPDVVIKHGEAVIRGVVEGILLTNYVFEQHKIEKKKTEPTVLLKKGALIGVGKNGLAFAKRSASLMFGVYLARDLVNGNADDITPQFLSSLAKQLAKEYKNVKSTVFDKKRIEKEQMGMLLAVNRGSANDPAFIIMEYRGNPKSKDHTVIVGKGITYDTGGLNLKPTGYMETMKCDMSGAATGFGVIKAAAEMGVKENVTVVVPTTENSIGAQSYKPGDVYVSYSGKSVEIGNTDAEGRLALADALAYAVAKLKPNRLIDFATLTGACVVALGEETTGLMSNNHELSNSLTNAGEATYERVWRLPLFEEYKEDLKSDIADLKNCGGREAGAIVAGMFLQEFVGDIPWAHLDIAGTAYLSKERDYNPKNATGVGVRLMLQFLEGKK